MPQFLIALSILASFACAFPSQNFIINAPTDPSDRIVLTAEEFQGQHPCAADSICDCSYDKDTQGNKYVMVDCSDRNLTELPKSLEGLDYPVGILYLRGNALTRAPDMTKNGYESVFFMTLNENYIETVAEEIVSPNLLILFMHYNRISRIDDKVLKKWSALPFTPWLSLDHNPLICDCESVDFIRFLRKVDREFRYYKTICAGSKIRILDLKLDELCANATVKASTVSNNQD